MSISEKNVESHHKYVVVREECLHNEYRPSSVRMRKKNKKKNSAK